MSKVNGAGAPEPETINGDARKQLKSFASRLMRLDEEIEGLKEDRKELLREVAGQGFDKALFVEAVKHVRDEDVPAYREDVAIMDLYLDAMLKDFETTPLGGAAARRREAEDIEIIPPGRRINAPPKALPRPRPNL